MGKASSRLDTSQVARKLLRPWSVCLIIPEILLLSDSLPQWFSSGTSFSEYAPGGHYKMSKEDKRENVIMVASEPLTFEKGESENLP